MDKISLLAVMFGRSKEESKQIVQYLQPQIHVCSKSSSFPK